MTVVGALILLMVVAGMAILLIGIGVVIVIVATRRPSPAATPLQIAGERYARGEIDRDQYEQIKHDLAT